ncbi:MAG TPA: MerR family transcriptional regulator [Pirellulales bacterium]|jgi:DNA-binding transcriptional MerR regulator/effector-binding domain-containing protein|nr:MerR family transcriptional regulator [Pirellulales bacterium]
MFTIGELSKLTQLSVKTLRFYHEQGLLIPACVDPDSGYRYYDTRHVETARAIVYLRSLEFPLSEIKQLLDSQDDDDLLALLERQQAGVQERIKRLRKAAKSLNQFIADERKARNMTQTTNDVHEKDLQPCLVGGIRTKGRYRDCGPLFGRLGRSLGRHICGSPLLLHYDDEYREEDADFEACMPVRQAVKVPEISVRELAGGRCVSLVHRGPYDQLGHSYAAIFKYIHDRKYRVLSPTREVYLKGPGMIFKGNPEKYLTEIQILIDTGEA